MEVSANGAAFQSLEGRFFKVDPGLAATGFTAGAVMVAGFWGFGAVEPVAATTAFLTKVAFVITGEVLAVALGLTTL